MRPYKNNAAYTLVELSVVLVIISLLTAGGLTLGAGMVNQAAHVDTSKILDQIDQSLRDYYTVNGRLPCPASRTLAITDANFGREVATGAACNVTGALTGTAYSNDVRIGMIPVRTLGLSDRAAADKYGNRILYAVTRQLTDANVFGDAASAGKIQVLPATGAAILTDAAYILWSAGKNHGGAPLYAANTTPTNCASISGLDVENCDNDNVFRDAPFNNGDVTANFFDDHVRWVPKFHLTAMTSSSDTLWAARGDGILFSVGTNGVFGDTYVGIGTDTPTERLHVDGNIRTDDSYYFNSTQHMKAENSRDIGVHSNHSDARLNLYNKDDHYFGAFHGEADAIGILDGDSNWGILIDKDNYTGFRINNNERMRIQNNGRVGIGTTNPQAALDVKGGKIRGELDCRQISASVGWGLSGAHSFCAADEYVISGGGQCGDQTNDHIAINRPWGNGWVAGCKRPSGGAYYYSTSSWAICCKY